MAPGAAPDETQKGGRPDGNRREGTFRTGEEILLPDGEKSGGSNTTLEIYRESSGSTVQGHLLLKRRWTEINPIKQTSTSRTTLRMLFARIVKTTIVSIADVHYRGC